MGSLNAIAFAESVEEGSCSLDAALSWHLQSNHFPPIPLAFLPVCKTAIEHANEGNWSAVVDLPAPFTFKGESQAPVWEIVDQHHLHAFLVSNEDEEF